MKIFGILNITPDSFSDGGKFVDPQSAHDQAKKMIADGAIAIDIGAESTRPGAKTLSTEEESQRLTPILNKLVGIPLSLDTRNPETAKKVLTYNNVKYLNDVSGFNNPEMVKLAADSGLHIIVMHSLTVPADKNIVLDTPPVETIQSWIQNKFKELTKAEIKPEKIVFDPGIGFGKTPEQSRELIDHAEILATTCHSLGTKILYGHSRKSFLGGDIIARDLETARISAHLRGKSVDYVRVHDVKGTYNAIQGVRY